MRLAAFAVGAVASLLTAPLAISARADDFSTGGGHAGARLDQQIDQAVKASGSSSGSDLDARVRDLEASRTAIDEKKKPAVSLSVSGWVDQQVQYNVK